MTLQFKEPPNTDSTKDVSQWMVDQLRNLEKYVNFGRDAMYLKELHKEPAKLKVGMVVLADGTDWNPGSGAGFYGYYGGAWNKLG